MKRKLALFQIFLISSLVCSCIQAQQSDTSLNDSASVKVARKSLPIKIQRPKSTREFLYPSFSFLVEFSSENIVIPVSVSAKTSFIWINSDSYSTIKGAQYKCSESKSCQGEKDLEFSWKVQYLTDTIWRTVVKEKVSFGGFYLPNLGVIMANHLDQQDTFDTKKNSGLLGLDFKRVNPEVPTIYEYLKAEGFIEEPIVSISLEDNEKGELVFGGYPRNKTRADFRFVRFLKEDCPSTKKLSVAINAIGYNYLSVDSKAVLDFNYPSINIPIWIYEKIQAVISDRGLRISYFRSQEQWHPDGSGPIKCEAVNVLSDLIVEFAGFKLHIPASAYIIRTKGYYRNSFEEASEESCFLALQSDGDTLTLGQPFFKAYDVIFDSESNSVGFSPKYDLDPSFNFIPYVILTISLASLVLLGFFFSLRAKKSRKPYMQFNGEGIELDRSPSPPPSSDNVPSQIAVGIPVQCVPYPVGFQNYTKVQSDEKIGEEN